MTTQLREWFGKLTELIDAGVSTTNIQEIMNGVKKFIGDLLDHAISVSEQLTTAGNKIADIEKEQDTQRTGLQQINAKNRNKDRGDEYKG